MAESAWHVRDFGAVGDGEADDTAAFQHALDVAGEAKGGVVYVSKGRYRFEGTLTIPRSVTLKGTFGSVPAHAGIRDRSDSTPQYGSVLEPYAGRGSAEGTPFITIQENATLQGFVVHYPEQKPDAAEPVPYPYAIAMRGNNPAVLDVELLNPYKGIDASQNQRHLVRNIHGQPIHTGVFVDFIYDIGRLENVHWNPWWSINTPIFEYQKSHGTGFIFGKSDWQYVLNTFCFGYHTGYAFIQTDSGECNGNFLGIAADDCRTAVRVSQCAPYGLLITNGQFVSIDGPEPTQVRVEETNSGVVRFTTCSFWGPAHRNAVIEGKGTVGFAECNFHDWGHGGEGVHAIDGRSGTLLVRGSEFHQDRPQIALHTGIQRAILTENVMRGQQRIQNDAGLNVVIQNNLGTV